MAVGSAVGGSVGESVAGTRVFAGTRVGLRLAASDGTADGAKEGTNLEKLGGFTYRDIVGCFDGFIDGRKRGKLFGVLVGKAVGRCDGGDDGFDVVDSKPGGNGETSVGAGDGLEDGLEIGQMVGESVKGFIGSEDGTNVERTGMGESVRKSRKGGLVGVRVGRMEGTLCGEDSVLGDIVGLLVADGSRDG